MSLIFCPECRVEVSDQALACPQCGFPIGKKARALAPRDAPRLPGIYTSALGITTTIVGRLSLFGVLLASGITYEAPPVILAGVAVFLSAIPVWWKARKAERSGGMIGDTGLEKRIEQRVAEAEAGFREQLADIDHNSRILAELEERIEFTERLLAKHRQQE
jgi:hypothetical protein